MFLPRVSWFFVCILTIGLGCSPTSWVRRGEVVPLIRDAPAGVCCPTLRCLWHSFTSVHRWVFGISRRFYRPMGYESAKRLFCCFSSVCVSSCVQTPRCLLSTLSPAYHRHDDWRGGCQTFSCGVHFHTVFICTVGSSPSVVSYRSIDWGCH